MCVVGVHQLPRQGVPPHVGVQGGILLYVFSRWVHTVPVSWCWLCAGGTDAGGGWRMGLGLWCHIQTTSLVQVCLGTKGAAAGGELSPWGLVS